MNLTLTQHAESRIRERGLRECDIPMIIDAGTPVDDDSLLLLDQDVDREIRRHKQAITALERLRGCRVVMVDDKVINVYRPSRRTEKRLLRGEHRHACGGHPSRGNHHNTLAGDHADAA